MPNETNVPEPTTPALADLGARMVAMMETITRHLDEFAYLEHLRAEEEKKELERDAAQAEKRAAAQKAYEDRQERNVVAEERQAAALESILAILKAKA